MSMVKCTATKNNGRACRQTELMSNGRCKYHQASKFEPLLDVVSDNETIVAPEPTTMNSSTNTETQTLDKATQTEAWGEEPDWN